MFTFNSLTLVCFICWFGCTVLSYSITFKEDLYQYCRTPQNAVGKCTIIKNCTSLDNFLKTHPKTPENINYIKQFHCGFEGIFSKVCCPPVDSETESRIDEEETSDDSTQKVNLLPNRDVCGKQYSDRIIGGEVADLQEFPWMVLLEYESENGNAFLCGGSLINSRYVLTAAHCLTNVQVSNSRKLVSVRLGEYDLNKEKDCFDEESQDCLDKPIDVKVQEQIPHEQFRFGYGDYAHDIALLRLSEEISYTDSIMPICLPLEGIPNFSEKVNVTVAGWGVTESKIRSAIKLKAELPVVPNFECSSVYEMKTRTKIGERQMCAGGIKGIDSCKGDSGGPLMFDDRKSDSENSVVIGVVSFGLGCGVENVPGVYTRVSSYIQWIIDHIKE